MRQEFEPVDFRLLAAIPAMVGWAMLLAPAILRGRLFGWVSGVVGPAGIVAWALVTIALLRYSQVTYFPLVRSRHADLVGRLDDWIVVELEDAATYDKFKLLPDDIGILYQDGAALRMRTNTRDLDITGALDPEAVASVPSNDKLKAAILHLPGGDVVVKPVYPGWDPRMHGSPQDKIAWMRSTLDAWKTGRRP